MSDALTDEELHYLAAVLDLARAGSTEQLCAAIAQGVPANLTGPTGDSLLILAAYHDHPETVRALLAAGADPERVNDRGQTALAAAVFRQSRVSVLALLGAGAGPSTGARSAAQIARFFGLSEMAQLLVEGVAGDGTIG